MEKVLVQQKKKKNKLAAPPNQQQTQTNSNPYVRPNLSKFFRRNQIGHRFNNYPNQQSVNIVEEEDARNCGMVEQDTAEDSSIHAQPNDVASTSEKFKPSNLDSCSTTQALMA